MNDLYSLIQAAKIDSTQMEALITKFYPLIRKYAYRLKKTEKEDAEQNMTVAFIIIVKNIELDKFDYHDSDKYLLSYIQKAMYTHFLDLARRQDVFFVTDIDEGIQQESIDDSLSPEGKAELREMLSSLTKMQREVILDKYLYGYSDVEIAKQLHITRQAVNRTKNRAIQTLKEKYK